VEALASSGLGRGGDEGRRAAIALGGRTLLRRLAQLAAAAGEADAAEGRGRGGGSQAALHAGLLQVARLECPLLPLLPRPFTPPHPVHRGA
jgi:hypothetical protein